MIKRMQIQHVFSRDFVADSKMMLRVSNFHTCIQHQKLGKYIYIFHGCSVRLGVSGIFTWNSWETRAVGARRQLALPDGHQSNLILALNKYRFKNRPVLITTKEIMLRRNVVQMEYFHCVPPFSQKSYISVQYSVHIHFLFL